MESLHRYNKSPLEFLRRGQGVEQKFGHGRFLLDPGVSAWVEQTLDSAENCSTPMPETQNSTQALLPGSNPRPEDWNRAGFGQDGGWLDAQKRMGRDSAQTLNFGRGRWAISL